MKVLCVSDSVERLLHGPGLNVYAAGVEAVISCGDLPFEYLEYIVTFLGAPVYYVRGNHDPAPETEKRPGGCIPLDGKVVDLGDVAVAGLSGSRAYSYGPNQYTERQMGLRAWSLTTKIWRRKLFGKPAPRVFVSHSPPFGVGDRKDPAHVGFESFLRLLDRYEPALWLHGHVHLYGPDEPRTVGYGRTRVVNVYEREILEI